MENSSKDNQSKKVNEPQSAYKSQAEIEKEEHSSSTLNQLLELSIIQCENGETRPHEEVMAEMKRKFNWSF